MKEHESNGGVATGANHHPLVGLPRRALAKLALLYGCLLALVAPHSLIISFYLTLFCHIAAGSKRARETKRELSPLTDCWYYNAQ